MIALRIVCILQPAAIKSNVKLNSSQQLLHLLVSMFLAPFAYLCVDLQTPLPYRPTQY